MSLFQNSLAEIAAVRTEALRDCNTVRAECYSQIDKQFDDIRSEIQATIQPYLSVHSNRLDQIKSNIQKLETQKTGLERSLAAETGGVFEADTIISTAANLLQTIVDPDDTIQIPTITVKRSAAWTAFKGARLKASLKLKASHRHTTQVFYNN